MSDITQDQALRDLKALSARRDAITIIIGSVAAAIGVIVLAIHKFQITFVSGGVLWDLPVKERSLTTAGLALSGGGGPVPAESITGTVSYVQVLVQNLGALPAFSLGASITLATLTALVIILCTARLGWVFMRGELFTSKARRLLTSLTWTIAMGSFAAYITWHLGIVGVEEALQVRAANTASLETWAWTFATVFAVVALKLTDIALTRAIRLQHVTEGLV